MKKSTKKKLKKVFNLYNLGILACIVMIAVAVIIIAEPDFSGITIRKSSETAEVDQNSEKNDGVNIVQNETGKEVSEKEARKLAKKQFKELDENVDVDDLEVLRITREGEKYYYISSENNTCEVKISTGEITRINSVKIEK